MTYTYVTMDVSPACFEEILLKLTEAGYDHAIHTERPGFGTKGNPNPVLLDMHGIALKMQPESPPTPHADAEGRKQTRAGKPTL